MKFLDWLARRGRRPEQNTAERGFEYFGAEPTDPSQDQNWRSVPHPGRIVVPTHADWLAEILKLVRDHQAGIDEATGPFADAFIDAQAQAHGLAARQHYPAQVRAEQGLYASEASYLEQLRLQEQALLHRIAAADEDYRSGRDALLGSLGATPAWDAGRSTGIGPDAPLPVPEPASMAQAPEGPAPREDTTGPGGLPSPEPAVSALAQAEDEQAA